VGTHDVIVVLGAPLDGDGRPGVALEARLRAGVAAFHDGRAAWLLVTGAGEAGPMCARAVELGVPRAAILVEPTARSTRENALASAVIMRRERMERALVVTQPFHLRRSVRAFRRAGVIADGLAAGGAPVRPSQLAREVVALAAYAVRGWI
jgi:uncharacterized SAM-binding protein YcdF (DUF218 family)